MCASFVPLGAYEATDRPKHRKRPRKDETEVDESLHFSFRFEDSPWCRHAASGSRLLYYQCALFAILKPKNRRFEDGPWLCVIRGWVYHSVYIDDDGGSFRIALPAIASRGEPQNKHENM